jgi:hypothetical protein
LPDDRPAATATEFTDAIREPVVPAWSGDAGPTPGRMVFADLCVTHHLIEFKTAHIPLLFSKPARGGKRSE